MGPKIMDKKKKITVLTVDAAAKNNGIENPYQLYLKTKTHLSIPRAKNLWFGKGKFSTEDFDILCESINCEISQLITRIEVSDETEEPVEIPMTVVLYSTDDKLITQIKENLQGSFELFVVGDVNSLYKLLDSNKEVRGVIFHIKKADDWHALGLAKSGFNSKTRFTLFNDEDDTPKNKKLTDTYGVSASFNVSNISSLGILLKTRLQAENQEQKAQILPLVASLWQELGRIQQEFFDSMMKTQPQSSVGDEIEDRLQSALEILQSIRIAA